MSRVERLGSDAIAAALRPLYERFTQGERDFTNQADILAHSPPAFIHLYGLIEALREESTLPQRIVEIAVVATSRVNECAYCVGHHGAALIRHGLPAETVKAILDDDTPGLDEKERLVRDYARLVTERAWGIRHQIFEKLREHFNDREIVELTVRIGLCGLFNKFNQALEISIEDDVTREITQSGLALSGIQPGENRR
jgi:uncharacterized peroxidase-related enzyme